MMSVQGWQRMRTQANRNFGLIEFIVPLLPILGFYNAFVLSTGVWLLYVATLYYLYRSQGKIKIVKPLIMCLGYYLIHDIIKAFVVPVENSFFNAMLEYTMSVFVILVFSGKIDFEKMYKWWKIISIPCYLGLIYHFILITVFHQLVTPIQILPSFIGTIEARLMERPVSVFAEPAKVIQFSFPLLYMALRKKDYLWTIITIVMMLICGSTTGILIIGIILIGYAMLTDLSLNKKIMICVVIGLGVCSLFSLDMFEQAATKLLNTNWSNNFRIVRGWRLYFGLDIPRKICGINYQTVEQYLRSEIKDPSLLFGGVSYFGYTSGITNSLLLYGLFGGLLYLNIYLKALKVSDKILRVFIIASIAMLFGEPDYMGSTAFLSHVLIIYGVNWKQKQIAIQ